jgi:hypothetical protein
MKKTTMTIATLGLAGLLTLTGYGAATTPADVAAETYALAAADLGDSTPAPAPSASAPAEPGKKGAKRHAARAYLRKNTLHGEIVVQGKDGPRTIVVQRGTVTATDGTSLSVKSTDGFTQTWTKAEKVTVRGDLRTGAEVGVAGRKDGDVTTARLVIVK